MAKKNPIKPTGGMKVREELPQMRKTDIGIGIFCPYCDPSHPLLPGKPAACGTFLKLTAVQQIMPARVARLQNIACIKCHTVGGGDLVPWQGNYVHLQDCDPETKLYVEPPVFSNYAKLLYKMPLGIQNILARKRGTPRPVKEITPEGMETGRILGYTFYTGV